MTENGINGAQAPAGAPAGRSERVSPERVASWGPWGEPVFGGVYGESGAGKSMDLARLGAGNWLFLAQEGGLKPAWSELRVDLRVRNQRIVIHTLEEATQLALGIGNLPDCGGWGGLGIDDLSLLLMNTHRAVERNPPRARGGEVNGFEVWALVLDKLHLFATTTRWAGLHTWWNAHIRGPTRDPKSGEFLRGGPATPSAKLTRLLGYYPDVLYRCGTEPGREPWSGIYEVFPDPDFGMKDRHGFSGRIPMNAAEILRSVGYRIAHPPGAEWIGQVAEEIATKLLEGADPAKLLPEASHRLYHRHKFDPLHIRWAVWQDGPDRAALRRRLTRGRLDALGIGATAEAGPKAPVAPAASRPTGGLV